MKIYKDDFAKASTIISKVSPKFCFVEKDAVNVRSYLMVKKEYKAGNGENVISYKITVNLYVEDLIREIRTGEEKKDSLADIQIVLFSQNQGIGLSQVYEVYSLSCFKELVNMLLKQLKNPVYVESSKYGNGYGFEEEEEYIVFFEKGKGTFDSSKMINKNHFQKIEKLKIQ